MDQQAHALCTCQLQGAPAAAAVAAAVIDGAAAAAKGVAVVLGVPDKTADGVDKTAAAAKGYLGVQESAPVALAAPAGNGQRSSQPAVEKPPSLDAVRVPTNQPSSEAQGASPLKGSPASSPTKSAGTHLRQCIICIGTSSHRVGEWNVLEWCQSSHICVWMPHVSLQPRRPSSIYIGLVDASFKLGCAVTYFVS